MYYIFGSRLKVLSFRSIRDSTLASQGTPSEITAGSVPLERPLKPCRRNVSLKAKACLLYHRGWLHALKAGVLCRRKRLCRLRGGLGRHLVHLATTHQLLKPTSCGKGRHPPMTHQQAQLVSGMKERRGDRMACV